ncbi:plasmid maintenance system antidote protein VapI [Pantoea sp. UYEF8]|jgi:plasmid maintenance system antidote protein VapI
MTMHNPPQAGGIISAMIEDPDIGIRELAAAMAIAPFSA